MARKPRRDAPLRLDQIQPADDAVRAIAEAAEGALTEQLLLALYQARASVPIEQLRAALAAHDFAHAIAMVPSDLRPFLQPAFDHMREISRTASDDALIGMGMEPRKLPMVELERLRYEVQQLGPRLAGANRAAIEQVVAQGLQARIPVADLAANLRDTVGLTPLQWRAAMNFRAMLRNNSREALTRELRDKAFDASIRRAIEAGTALPESRIERMVARYIDRMLESRAGEIAGTESHRAAVEGARGAYREVELSGGDVRRFWLTARDERVCPICRAIPGMNPDGVDLDEPFASPYGPISGPEQSHPRCRCTERHVIVSSPAQLPAVITPEREAAS